MRYVFRCRECSAKKETDRHTPAPTCPRHGDMRRDYRGEAVNVDRSWAR